MLQSGVKWGHFWLQFRASSGSEPYSWPSLLGSSMMSLHGLFTSISVPICGWNADISLIRWVFSLVASLSNPFLTPGWTDLHRSIEIRLFLLPRIYGPIRCDCDWKSYHWVRSHVGRHPRYDSYSCHGCILDSARKYTRNDCHHRKCDSNCVT